MKRWHFWAGIIISAIFLYFSLRGLQIETVWDEIRTAQFIWLIPGIFIYFLGVCLRVLRWRLFLLPIKSISLSDLIPVVAIGYMGNNIYPARAGELLRTIVIKYQQGIAISSSLATIIIERIFDSLIMLGFITLNLTSLSTISTLRTFSVTIQTATLWASIVFIFALICFFIAAFFPERSQKIITSFINMLPSKLREKALTITHKFFEGIRSLASPVIVIEVLMLTAAIWLLETVFYWFVMQAFPFNIEFSMLMLLNGVVNLITVIPSSPGYIGTFDAPGIALLTALGVNKEIAASYIILLHASLWLPITVIGAVFFGKIGLDWSSELDRARLERNS